MHRKKLHDDLIDTTEFEDLCYLFTKFLDETSKIGYFTKVNVKPTFFSFKKIKLNLKLLEPRS